MIAAIDGGSVLLLLVEGAEQLPLRSPEAALHLLLLLLVHLLLRERPPDPPVLPVLGVIPLLWVLLQWRIFQIRDPDSRPRGVL